MLNLPVLIRTNLAVLKKLPLLQWTQQDVRSPPSPPSHHSKVIMWFGELRLSSNYSTLINERQVTGKVVNMMHSIQDWQLLGIHKYGDIRKLLKATSQPPFDGSKKEYVTS